MLTRRYTEQPVVLGQQPAVVEQVVGLDNGPDVGQTHLLDQPILSRTKGAFDSTFGLGAVGPAQVDAQFTQSPAKLRFRLGQGLALVLHFENTVPVGVQRQRATVGLQPTQQQIHVVKHRIRVVEAGQQPAGGVIDHVD